MLQKRRMRFKIRGKFIGILVIAAVLPLVIAIIGVQVLGYRYYKVQRGRLYEAIARHLAVMLDEGVDRQVDKLENWVVLGNPQPFLARQNAAVAGIPDADIAKQSLAIDGQWPGMKFNAPLLESILTNEVSRTLLDFQNVNPLFAEMLVTDARGRLVAATEKTSDYWQADEVWWQRAITVRHGMAYLEGIQFDESAGVYSLDVCVPIRPRGQPTAPPLGVIKAVLNASPLFSGAARVISDERVSRQIVHPDGRVLFDLLKDKAKPPHGMCFDLYALGLSRADDTGWTVAKLDTRGPRLIGYAPMRFARSHRDENVAAGIEPMFVLAHDDAMAVMAPVRRQLWMLAALGALVLSAFALTGYYIATRKIIHPIEMLRSAARMLAASAKITGASSERDLLPASSDAVDLLDRIHQIRTDDEIEDLARDFGSMSRRVLSYHEQLEKEIAAKTAEMQRDLQMAREFQEALMPRSYPAVPSEPAPGELRLRFHHEYRAASTVGGDFFDVHKLSDHQAGIFIADVMGHGARSALVTAILRTLLQDLRDQAGDPAKFLALINEHFYDMTNQTGQFVFVSAFYLVFDTERALATYAAAGHPSPWLADRSRRTVMPLIERLQDNPVIGLFSNSRYTSFTSFIKKDDLVVLYTDGLDEAVNAEGEEFGGDRVRQIIGKNLHRDAAGISGAIMTALSQHTGATPPLDDICLVAVEIGDGA